MTRESVEGRELEEPQTGPSVRRCRPAERERVLSALDDGERVLDVGSAPCVTARVDAESIERLDFSTTESRTVRAALEDDPSVSVGRTPGSAGGSVRSGESAADGPRVEDFTVIDPDEPSIPFPDDSFDVAVAVGAYDWPGLEAETLTREVGRVLEPSGRLVASTLAPRSPDLSPDGPLVARDPDATADLLAPGWELERCDPVNPRTDRPFGILDAVPSRLRSAIDRCRTALSGAESHREREGDGPTATVVAGRPLPYERWLEAALECLFRPVDDGGFWDPRGGRFVAALAADAPDAAPEPVRDLEAERSRTPFVAAAVLRWRTSDAGTDAFDDQLRDLLSHCRSLADPEAPDADRSPAATGALIEACARAGTGPFDAANVAVARECFERSRGCAFDRTADAALLGGWATLAGTAGAADPAHADGDSIGAGAGLADIGDGVADDRVLAALDEGLWRASRRLFSPDALLESSRPLDEGRLRALRGVCRAIDATGRTGFLEDVACDLERLVETRLRDDGAVVPDLPSPRHQLSFVGTVARYAAAGGPRDYDREVARAMARLEGGGRDEDDAPLEGGGPLERGSLDVPSRVVGVDGPADARQIVTRLDDVGAFVSATTDLIAGPLAPPSPVGPERIPAPTRSG